MSVTGRNQHRGSTCHVYRAVKSEREGGLTGRTWVRVAPDVRLAIMASSAEIATKIWGQEAAIEAVVVVDTRGPRPIDIRAEDAIVVLSGEFHGERFYVQAMRSLRTLRECGLVRTPEVIDASLPGVDPDREPLGVG